MLFYHWQKQNYRLQHSDQAFNAGQREISIEPVSITKGCRFTYQSHFYSLKVYSKLTMALTVVSIGEERALFNQYFRKKSNYSKQ